MCERNIFFMNLLTPVEFSLQHIQTIRILERTISSEPYWQWMLAIKTKNVEHYSLN